MITDLENKTQEVIFRELMPEIPSTTYATFGLYKYPAKFIPQIIAYALNEYGQNGKSVIDPFAGYGTVGTVARLNGNDYELWDLNPLLKHLHRIAVMNPTDLNASDIIKNIENCKREFIPDWSNQNYWFNEEFIPLLYKSWGYYHSLTNQEERNLLLIPLIKTTRYFSNNDDKRQKLSRSPISKKRIEKLLTQNWEVIFFSMIEKYIKQIQQKLVEYKNLNPKNVTSEIKAGINSLKTKPSRNYDIVITSPPYLQAQEYIRATKMDLFWLGYEENYIRELGKLELPYQEVPEIQIHSETYNSCLEQINEEHMRKIYTRYFYGVLGTLTKLQEYINDRLILFVGPATIRTKPIPIDRIFMEHFTKIGWKHEATLIDKIVARAMFYYEKNPATGQKDNRMKTEHMLILTRM